MGGQCLKLGLFWVVQGMQGASTIGSTLGSGASSAGRFMSSLWGGTKSGEAKPDGAA